MDAILSLDIGGTKIAASVVRPDGTVLSRQRAPSRAREGPDRLIARLGELARRARDEAGVAVSRAGISCGGPLDPVSGLVLNPPNLPGWERVPLRELMARRLGIAPDRVHLENDANACALAELRFGAGRGRSHLVFMTMSTGIGGGLILDGRLYRGAGYQAGEVGHQIVWPDGPVCGCGRLGCLEAVASGSGIARRLRERFDALPAMMRRAAGSADAIGAEHLIEAVRLGDPWAAGFLAETVGLLARGIANLVFILNPGIVILGTIAHHAGDLILPPLRQEVTRLCWPILSRGLEIVATPLGPRLEELSGLSVALEAAGAAGCPPNLASP